MSHRHRSYESRTELRCIIHLQLIRDEAIHALLIAAPMHDWPQVLVDILLMLSEDQRAILASVHAHVPIQAAAITARTHIYIINTHMYRCNDAMRCDA